MKNLSVLVLVFVMASSVTAETIYADADGFANGINISNAFAGITLSVVGGYPGLDGKVYAWFDTKASTGTTVFDNNISTPFEQQWIIDDIVGIEFRADFAQPARTVTIDIIGNDNVDSGALYAYNAAGQLIDSVESPLLSYSQVFTATVSSDSFDIKYIIAGGAESHAVHLDNLTAEIPEPATLLLLTIGVIILKKSQRKKPQS